MKNVELDNSQIAEKQPHRATKYLRNLGLAGVVTFAVACNGSEGAVDSSKPNEDTSAISSQYKEWAATNPTQPTCEGSQAQEDELGNLVITLINPNQPAAGEDNAFSVVARYGTRTGDSVGNGGSVVQPDEKGKIIIPSSVVDALKREEAGVVTTALLSTPVNKEPKTEHTDTDQMLDVYTDDPNLLDGRIEGKDIARYNKLTEFMRQHSELCGLIEIIDGKIDNKDVKGLQNRR